MTAAVVAIGAVGAARAFGTFAPVVGLIVMIVEAEKTQTSEVMAALDLVRACENVMLMLNKIKLTTSYTFGAYHYFGTYT